MRSYVFLFNILRFQNAVWILHLRCILVWTGPFQCWRATMTARWMEPWHPRPFWCHLPSLSLSLVLLQPHWPFCCFLNVSEAPSHLRAFAFMVFSAWSACPDILCSFIHILRFLLKRHQLSEASCISFLGLPYKYHRLSALDSRN